MPAMKKTRCTIKAGRLAGIALALLWTLIGPGMVATAAAGNDWTKPRMSDYVQLPPFVAYSVKPNIMILLDNSGSMNSAAYGGHYLGEPYNDAGQPAVRYYGYFNPDFFYTYDATNRLFVPTHRKGPYNSTARSWQVAEVLRTGAGSGPLDSTAIVERNLWDGNWLNWMTMRRIDILRKVLVGGRVEDASSTSGTGLQVLVGENNAFMNVISKTHDPGAHIAVSPHAGSQTYRLNLNGTLEAGSTRYVRVEKDSRFEPEDFLDGALAGVLQRVGDQARWGNMWFNRRITANWGAENVAGGYVAHPIGNGVPANMIEDLRTKTCDTWTPLAETFYVALHYFRGDPVVGSEFTNTFATGNNYVDPFIDTALGQPVPCAPSFVLLLTDGASTQDRAIPASAKEYGYARDTADNIPEHLLDFDPEPWTVGAQYANNGTDYLADLALYARYNNLRDKGDFACYDNNIVLYTIVAMLDEQEPEYAAARELLMKAALLGGYGDSNGDGVPDTYYEAADGYQLERDLAQIFGDMVARAATGTAASVVSNPRSGQGAIYQSLFFPALSDDAGNTIKWAGQVHGLLMDRYGNLREDTPNAQGKRNAKLDLTGSTGQPADRFLVFNTEAPARPDGCPPPEGERVTVSRYSATDDDGNPRNAPDLEGDPVDTVEPHAIHYLWSSSDWLNAPDLQPTAQRTYSANAPKRHIFTFVSSTGAMVAQQNGSDIRPFVAGERPPSWNQMINPADFWAYLHVYDPFAPPADLVGNEDRLQEMVTHQARRVVNFIRGEDQGATTTSPNGVPLATFRSRQHNGRTWRLADIVHASPTVVGRPAENYDLIYRDTSYTEFYRRYRHRRNVVYVGSNGGMLHAFNAGFYNDFNRQFATVPHDDGGQPIKPPQGLLPPNNNEYNDIGLGAELWAYVPFNLLPHLYWLTRPDYEHIYYVDLEPRIFDARIFTPDADHPNGWGTVLVAGMRLGGGKIGAQIVKGGTNFDPEKDRALSSAYAVFDITNPEKPPRLLAELTFPELGFTTCHPGVILMEGADGETSAHQWYLIFGSGPVSPGKDDVNGANTTALSEGTSSQQAVMYAVDLVKLAAGQLEMLTHGAAGGPSTTALTSGADPTSRYMVRFNEPDSSVSRPISVDWNLNYKTDAVYFGTSSGNHDDGWGGKMRRLVLNGNTNPAQWQVDNTMLDLMPGALGNDRPTGQPIMARPTAGIDREGNRWLFFGTGRFLSASDKANTDGQSFYGLKETRGNDGAYSYPSVALSALENVSNVVVYESGNRLDGLAGDYTPVGGGDDFLFDDFRDLIQGPERGGWRFDLQDIGERNTTRPALAGEILTFTTYSPSEDVCSSAGLGRLYALYYTTGTAFSRSVIGTQTTNDGAVVLNSRILGPGMPPPASLMVGAGHGTKALVGGEGGDFQTISQETPGKVKSGRVFWRIDEGKYECEDEPLFEQEEQ